MDSQKDIQPGNWFTDTTDNNFCIIRELTPFLKAERFQDSIYIIPLSRLEPIRITRDNLSVAKFQFAGDHFELMSNKNCILHPLGRKKFAWVFDGEKISEIEFIHELQNSYQKSIGEELPLNLFGIR